MKKKGIIICVCVIIGLFVGLLIGWLYFGSVVNNLKEADEIEYLGERYYSDIDDILSDDFNVDFTIDEKLAAKIGIAVLKSIFGEDFYSEREYIVSEIEKEDMFVVTMSSKEWSMGDCVSVFISKKDGAILKIWVAE